MNHIPALQQLVKQKKYDALLLLSPENRFYATGFRSSSGALLVTEDKAFFFTDSRYIEKAEREIVSCSVHLSSFETPYHKLAFEALTDTGVKSIGFEDDFLTYATHKNLKKHLPFRFLPAEKDLEALRSVKDEEELSYMKAAQRITDEVFSEILPLIRPGVGELDLAAEIVYRLMKKGAEKPSFDPIVVSGENSSMPHGTPGDRPFKPGDFLTMDFGCVLSGYCSDMTRTVAIGHATDEMKRVYETVLAAQLKGIAAARAGVTGEEVDRAAREYIASKGYGEFFGHGFGHSLGIKIHEPPRAAPGGRAPLLPGTVISAEPGIYLPGRFGVRIEDVIVIREGGAENLTKSEKQLIIL